MRPRRRTASLHARVAALGVLGVLLTVATALAVTTVRIEPHHDHTAVFTEVSGMRIASDVRAAGVTLGRVEAMDVRADNTVEVEFTVADEFPMTTGTEITVRYKNLLGDRYLELSNTPGAPLPDGATVPATRTHPALDIDELTNGFAPLLQGLAPEQANRLAGSLVAVTQGQEEAVEPLLHRIGSLTGALADRDAAIGSLVTDLAAVLRTADERAPRLDELVRRLQGVVSGLADDRGRLGRDLARIDGATRTLTDVLPALRPGIRGTVRETERFSRLVNADSTAIDQDLRRLPGHQQVLGRLGAYSSSLNGYLCGIALRLPGGATTPPILASQGRDQRCAF